MKYTVKRVKKPTDGGFKPIQINITLTSAHETAVWKQLFGHNFTVANCLRDEGHINKEDVPFLANMLSGIYWDM
jgi:hypothetical protein